MAEVGVMVWRHVLHMKQGFKGSIVIVRFLTISFSSHFSPIDTLRGKTALFSIHHAMTPCSHFTIMQYT